jgi:hypothetical protein
MPNKYHGNLTGNGKFSGGSNKDSRGGSSPSSMPEKTASWPGLPGKTGPDRSGGVKKLKVHPKSEGM